MASSFGKLVRALKKLPSIGNKSAERIAFHLLKAPADEVTSLIKATEDFISKTSFCNICGLISENNPCKICTSATRNQTLICVVKSVQDAINIERSKSYLGLYHVLGGLISPIHNIDEENISISKLLNRIDTSTKELVFALEQTPEARTTIKTIQKKIDGKLALKITEVAIGIPVGAELEYIDQLTLKNSIAHRRAIS